jgi:hypothetical protein
MLQNETEVWQTGVVEGVPLMLQPVAHALMQANKEVHFYMQHFNDDHLWLKPDNLASTAFHLQHISGVLDRLFTYARGESLTEEQFNYLKHEGIADEAITTTQLLLHFDNQLEKCLVQIKNTPESSLLDIRYVGRKRVQSNIIGLLFHAAEHTMRHVGQLLVTVKVIKAQAYCSERRRSL